MYQRGREAAMELKWAPSLVNGKVSSTAPGHVRAHLPPCVGALKAHLASQCKRSLHQVVICGFLGVVP